MTADDGVPDEAAPDDLGWGAAQERLVAHLRTRLPDLVSRRVPVRALGPGPLRGVGRLRFADASVFLVRATRAGDMGTLVRSLGRSRSVTVEAWELTPEGLAIVLTGVEGRSPVRLWLLGDDQPD